MVAGLEVSRILSDYYSKYSEVIVNTDKHHEQIGSIQTKFLKDVKNIINCIEEAGNPFLEDSGDLLTLDTKVIMSSDVVNDIKKAESTGSEQFTKFCHERLENMKSLFKIQFQKTN